jgi:ribosome-associated protein YbcJ (S4-like RNA binding protein)
VAREPIVDVPLSGEPIRLGQFLKLVGFAGTGRTPKSCWRRARFR